MYGYVLLIASFLVSSSHETSTAQMVKAKKLKLLFDLDLRMNKKLIYRWSGGGGHAYVLARVERQERVGLT